MLTSSASLQFSDSEFQTVGALTQNAFVDKANDNLGTVSKFLFEDLSSRTRLYNCRAVTPGKKECPSISSCASTVPVCKRSFDAPAINGARNVVRWHWRTAENDRLPWPAHSERPGTCSGTGPMYRAVESYSNQVELIRCR